MKKALRQPILSLAGVAVLFALTSVGCAPSVATSVQPDDGSFPASEDAAASAISSSASPPALPPVSESVASVSSSVNPALTVATSNLATASAASAPATAPTHRAQIDFGAPVGDAYLRTILERHDAKMVVAYMTTAGFFGAHRAATSTAPALFIASARAETVSGFSNGAGGGMTTRAREFVREHSAADVTGDADVRKRAESLLDLHRRLESARSNAVGGSALIHAVEVHGIESRLRLLGTERGVVGFEIAAIGSDVHWSRPSLSSGASGSSGVGGASGASDDGQALYDRLSALADRE